VNGDADALPGAPARSRGASPGRVLLVAGALALALFGSLLLVFTPSLEGRPGLQTLWVLASLVLLKLPLLLLVWWVIVRRRSRATPPWSRETTDAFLARARDGVARAREGRAPAVGLDDLRREVWAATAHADPAAAQQLVDLALEIDRIARRGPPSGRGAGEHVAAVGGRSPAP
jgi:hypothetical protein